MAEVIAIAALGVGVFAAACATVSALKDARDWARTHRKKKELLGPVAVDSKMVKIEAKYNQLASWTYGQSKECKCKYSSSLLPANSDTAIQSTEPWPSTALKENCGTI
jgi:hypothetical protein